MPGRAWYVSDRALLPIPPYDRLEFRQAIGVPVAADVLAVDGWLVRDAEEVYVRLDANRTVAGSVNRLSYRGAVRKEPPLAFIRVAGHTFAPLKLDAGVGARPDQTVTVYGLNCYEEMGRAPRIVPTTVATAAKDGKFTLAEGLVAGEAGAPVVTQRGRLVGFMTGRVNAMAAGGGRTDCIPPAEIAELLKLANRGSVRHISYGRVKRLPAAKDEPVKGRAFVVYGIAVETLE
jgi:hypothetical protein